MSRASTLASAAILGLVLIGPPSTRAQNSPYGPVAPGPEDSIIATFTAERTAPRTFRFSWTMEQDDDDEVVVCQLNFDGDEVVEESIENCTDQTSARFRYDEPGTYGAVLTARSRDGGSDVAHVQVVVEE